METEEGAKVSIYKAARSIKKRENSLYNALRSIYQDSIFVSEICQLWPELPVLANLRCGLWYSRSFHSTSYFKSTDGHTNNCSFSTSRLNLHVALLAGQNGGCIIVDSTRRGKRFPDSMSKTIPIWTCVFNRAIRDFRESNHQTSLPWDCSLHLPLWVSQTERASIEDRLDEWTLLLKATGTDIASLSASLRKPLRPLWISQKTLIWLNQVPHHDSWDFTPIILLSASSTLAVTQHTTTSEFSWIYIPGAGDDEETWARGLSPSLFWKHVYDLINSGPHVCNQKVADIVENSRVCRAYKGESAPQITVKSIKATSLSHQEPSVTYDASNDEINESSSVDCGISWLGSTNLAVGTSQVATALSISFIYQVYLADCSMPTFGAAADAADVDCILNCDCESISVCLLPSADSYLHLPMVVSMKWKENLLLSLLSFFTSKFDRFSLLNNLAKAVSFAKFNLSQGKRLLVCCNNGEDISVCVCLAILMSLFDEKGTFDDGKSFNATQITKWDMKRRLVYVCKFATDARPSRGNLRQVFNFLIGGKRVHHLDTGRDESLELELQGPSE
ncbi:SPAC3F10.06c [Mucuna pruriens]|uniref:SPAC3F10.06c n=1 Tax=Mucuna pruriens TaxID=157652 RepID=A0A371EEZ6_MUCPR|nr:SPAC3F10.06c [Mucuna pruriens]